MYNMYDVHTSQDKLVSLYHGSSAGPVWGLNLEPYVMYVEYVYENMFLHCISESETTIV